jgi:hypothetical protein
MNDGPNVHGKIILITYPVKGRERPSLVPGLLNDLVGEYCDPGEVVSWKPA